MGKTSIEWTDSSWPLVNGCRRASPGCTNCYAERLISTRLRHHPKYKGLAIYKEGKGPQWTGETRLWTPDLTMPLRLRKHQKIFVADMGDLFYEKVPDADIDQVFGIMLACEFLENRTNHTFQVLTKRADRMREYLSAPPPALLERWSTAVQGIVHVGDGTEHFWEAVRSNTAHAWGPDGTAPRDDPSTPWQHYQKLFPLPNVWLGVSVEDQKYANERIPELLQTPAHTRFVSYEPALGPVDFGQIGDGTWYDKEGADRYDALQGRAYWGNGDHGLSGGPKLDQIIVGGESGVGARACDVAWIRSVVAQCKTAGTACFVKQFGRGRRAKGAYHHDDSSTGTTIDVQHSKGSDWTEWPADLRVREFPAQRGGNEHALRDRMLLVGAPLLEAELRMEADRG